MPSKKALIIASPYEGLRGPLNDATNVGKALGSLGFEVVECSGNAATRDGILCGLNKLAHGVSYGDTIVVYYSGHGGLAESEDQEWSIDDLDIQSPRRYQFLVPMDFQKTGQDDFRGVLDLQLSSILRMMTTKTPNVTAILDCCHAGRMARDPTFGPDAAPRSISGVHFSEISRYVDRLGITEKSVRETDIEENPLLVCVNAAGLSETAWEYRNAQGEWCGALTEALLKVITASKGHLIPWRAILHRLSELLNANFPNQHPYVTGPGNRFRFSLLESTFGAFLVRNEPDGATIHAGRVSGVEEGNIYTVMDHGAKKGVVEERLAEAEVSQTTAFKALVKLTFNESRASRLPDDGALAFLQHAALSRWPVALPSGFPWLETLVRESKFVRSQEPEDGGFIIAELHYTPDCIVLRSSRGLDVTSIGFDHTLDEQLKLVEAVEQLARAQHLFGLRNSRPDDTLQHLVRTDFVALEDSNSHRPNRLIRQDGTDCLTENSRICFAMVNNGSTAVYATIFNINAVGKIGRLSRSGSVELKPGKGEVVGKRGDLVGLSVRWPQGVSRSSPLQESYLIILTSTPVDLDHLAKPASQPSSERTSLSNLEKLTWKIASGYGRDGKGIEDEAVRYDTLCISIQLVPLHT
jgi:Caspase domain